MKQYSRIVADSICQSRILSGIRGYFHEQGFASTQRTEQVSHLGWTDLGVSQQRPECQSLVPGGVCEQTYYKWQRRLFELAPAQQEVQFAEVTPVQPARCGNVSVTVRIPGAEADIRSGADAAAVETVLRILKSC